VEKLHLPHRITSELACLKENWRADAVSGFLVFLIALPLCLGVAIASGFPPVAGIIPAVIGGLLVSRINGSRLTITGPAAGLITVVYAAVETMGAGDPLAGYRYTLAAIVVAGGLQFLLGRFRAGRLSAFFPPSVVHGMLAAIGIIILTKQAHVLIGSSPPPGTLFDILARIPKSLLHFNPETALIGGVGLLILFAWPQLKHSAMGRIPAPMLVVLTGLLLGQAFDLTHSRLYVGSLGAEGDMLHRHGYMIGSQFVAGIPASLLDGLTFPDFSRIGTGDFWAAVVGLCLIGSLESLLVCAAVDKLDPEGRDSDPNRDLAAVGAGNVLSGLIGGLPMIVEIVRSSANIDYGAKSGWSNFFHGAFLLLFVMLFPGLIHSIPLASLAALLIHAGFRLASPQAFARTLDIGREQMTLFLLTIAGILATDLLTGVAIGIIAKLAIHLWRGVGLRNLFQISFHITREADGTQRVKVDGAAVFSNFLALKSELAEIHAGGTVIFDLSHADMIDHTVMEFIDHFRQTYIERNGRCEIHGLDRHAPYADHPLAARRKEMAD
jgi:MFS superfamily sulfate permease-like transporter